MKWYPKTLKCQVYENEQLVDLTSCSDSVLENLADAIFPLWKTPVDSYIWFDVEIYEKQYWFKCPKNSIEIVAYKRDIYSATGRKQVTISNLNIEKMIGKKFQIKPENNVIRKWSENTQVAFII